MKNLYFYFCIISIFIGNAVFSQKTAIDPALLTTEVKKISDKEFELIVHVAIKDGWHIYSQNVKDGGPIPTSLTFSKNPLVEFIGKVKEVGKVESNFDPNFNLELLYYSNTVDFVQKIKLKAKAKTSITAKMEYMVCTNKECLPPKTKSVNFNF